MAKKRNAKNAKKKRDINYVNMTVAVIALVVMLISGGFVGQQMYVKSVYPLEYSEEIVQYSEEFDVDPILVASVICRESKYKRKAESKAGAIGLMQIMPDTGEWIAKELDVEDFETDDLFAAKTNVRFGCYYLDYCLEKFDGQRDEALAAYNAGPNKVNEWLKDSRYSSDEKTLDNIPFEETATYVETINKYYDMYKKYYSKDLL